MNINLIYYLKLNNLLKQLGFLVCVHKNIPLFVSDYIQQHFSQQQDSLWGIHSK